MRVFESFHLADDLRYHTGYDKQIGCLIPVWEYKKRELIMIQMLDANPYV